MCRLDLEALPFGQGDIWDYHFNGMHYGKLTGPEVLEIYSGNRFVNTSCEVFFELEDRRHRYSFNFNHNEIRRSDSRYQEVVTSCLNANKKQEPKTCKP